ncbi:Putative zn(2)Cys(6) fungal-type DNA-binding domain-containing protein [Colletotrichum destructivum]|uniref:Zn(2)Cys(6) fungal-type DNA-binding domain-containing protein n=1 Tax=Colletotrichum destructivum TaxID=34406 RepID=A0AAX4J3D2_9PEZI|nr:Putative zn(2)Cys(6) fungal-type DNA-binding domain-containing protein [Colletotrichum destructivum]
MPFFPGTTLSLSPWASQRPSPRCWAYNVTCVSRHGSNDLKMTSPQSTSPPSCQHKHVCSLCARRKVKCDKAEPCSNCVKSKAQCVYEVPIQPRPRKRAADEELLARLRTYEELMRKHGVDFATYAHTWITTGPQGQVKQCDSPGPVSAPAAAEDGGLRIQAEDDSPAETERSVLLFHAQRAGHASPFPMDLT